MIIKQKCTEKLFKKNPKPPLPKVQDNLHQNIHELSQNLLVYEPLMKIIEVEKPTNNYHLTDREKEILELLTKGFSYKMIGIKCNISIETVRRYLKNICQKFHV